MICSNIMKLYYHALKIYPNDFFSFRIMTSRLYSIITYVSCMGSKDQFSMRDKAREGIRYDYSG